MLAQAVELRDDYTGGHTQRVTRYATMLGEKLELPDDQLELIKIGGPLHDIGKIGIDDAILRKPGRLTAEEFAIMQTHTTKGAEILSTIPEMQSIIPIVRNHHERWDGTGYPDRLAGEAIPLLARIVAVADAFDAMTSNRPYHENKKGKPPSWAFAEVEKQAGQAVRPGVRGRVRGDPRADRPRDGRTAARQRAGRPGAGHRHRVHPRPAGLSRVL